MISAANARATPAAAPSLPARTRAAASAPHKERAYTPAHTGAGVRHSANPTGGMYIFADFGVETSTNTKTTDTAMYIAKPGCTPGDLT